MPGPGPPRRRPSDSEPYELGTWFTVTSTTTLTGIRIWNPGLVAPGGGQPRQARLWTHVSGSSATAVRVVALPAVLPVGWSEWSFANYEALTSGQYCVSYFVDSPAAGLATADYGTVNGAFHTAVPGRITFPVSAGRYNGVSAPGAFPAAPPGWEPTRSTAST